MELFTAKFWRQVIGAMILIFLADGALHIFDPHLGLPLAVFLAIRASIAIDRP